jgi:hypothetical protein
MFISCNSNTTDGTSAAGSAYPSGTPEPTPGFCGVQLWVFLQDNAGDCVIYRCLLLLMYLVHQETVVVVIVW